MPSTPPAAKALLAALGFAERGVEVAELPALVAAVALAAAVVLSEDGTVIELVGSRMVVLRAALELAKVTLGVALVEWVELLLVVRRALDVKAVEVALADRVVIEMEEPGRVMDADEVGTWTCPSEICVTGRPLVADTDTDTDPDPDAELEAALEVMLDAEEEAEDKGPAAFEIPNWVEYWY